MKKSMKTLTSIFIPCALVLSACSKAPFGAGEISSKGFLGAMSAKIESLQLPPYLTAEEARLAVDPAYMILKTQTDYSSNTFNLTAWPKKCSQEPSAIYPCPKDNPSEMQGLRDITYSGQVAIIDSKEEPWIFLDNKRDIRSLVIEADKIIIRSRLNLPSTKIQLNAEKVIVEDDGVLDVTPADMGAIRPAYKEGMSVASDGINGIDGSEIVIHADSLEVLGHSKERFIAKGGAGQGAGEGRGQSVEAFAKSPLYAASKSAIPANEVPAAFRNYAASVIFSDEHTYGWEQDCFGESGMNCQVIEKTAGARGTNQWPADGMNAIAGGHPGAGGAGGKVFVFANTANNISSLANVSAGANGVADGLRKGSLGGLPNPAYMVKWTERDHPYIAVPRLESHTQKNGQDAQSPMGPRETKGVGEILVQAPNASARPGLSKSYFDLKIKRIKELYFARKFDQAINLVNQVDSAMDGLKTMNGELIPVITQLTVLRQSLISQKDYYGRGLQDAPMFAFNFNLAQYQSQVRQAMRAYYLASVFKKEYESKKERLQAVKDALDAMEANLAETVNTVASSNNAISNLSYKIELVYQQQSSLESDLKQLEEQIRELAEKNVLSRHAADEFYKFVDTAAAICQVIPAGQPALGAVATVVRASVKGPKEKSLQGFISHYKEFKDQLNGLEGKAKFEESKANWNSFKEKFDFSKLKGKSWEEKGKYLQGLYNELSPVAEKINEILGPLNQPTYSQDEIQQEIAKIKAADELFKGVSKKLEELLANKVKIQNDLLGFAKLVDQLTVQMSDYVAVSSKISGDALASDWAEDGVLSFTFSKVAQDAEERALYLFDETVRSYNYLTLENYDQPISPMHLRQKMEEALQKNNAGEAINILNLFYDVQVDSLKQALSDRLRQASPLIVVNPASNKIVLTPAEVVALNNDGYVDIELTKDFYMESENTRIDSIEVNQYEFTKGQGEEIRFPAIRLGFTLDKKGSLMMNNKKYTFFYPSLGTRFIWENTFTFQNDEVEMQKNQNPDTYKGIIDSLSDGQKIDSKIFAMHAGLTKMRIKIVKKQGSYRFKKLSIKVNYVYSTSTETVRE